MKRFLTFLLTLIMSTAAHAWQQVNENAPEPPREFRAAWVATVFNLDWPSRAGLSAGQQKQELLNIITRAHQLKLNAIILQVRPNGDALYQSSLEPWSGWLSGPGVNPGYDPLTFAITECHKRGMELHAWFNPFRATVSNRPVGRGHISHRKPGWLLRAGSTTMLNPANSSARDHVMKVILDVVRRYNIDGVHLDDYFYPYPPHHKVADGKSPSQRRAYIDDFVRALYSQVKSIKPYVRVGISPFGIWQPGYPRSVEAGVNAYEHLACDARKWIARGWVDYLSPQLYWRCEGPQSFNALMGWWSSINPSRPIWPGIASVRVNSSEDPGRKASEIGRQIDYSRQLARQSCGQLYWSWKSLGSNRGGVCGELAKRYTTLAVPPPMPWSGSERPARPVVQARDVRGGCQVSWQSDGSARKWVVQVGRGGKWWPMYILSGANRQIILPSKVAAGIDRIAVRPISGTGVSGTPGVLAR